MTFVDLELHVIQWAEARKIIPNSTPEAQYMKAISEMGELADALLKKTPMTSKMLLGIR